MDYTRRINIWSSPRNISTAIMYAFAQRVDTKVIDEPLYGHYLKFSGANHPGKEEIMASMECNGEKVIRNILLGEYHKSVVVFKQMTHHLPGLTLDFLDQMMHVLLIRNPEEIIASYVKVRKQPNLADIGVKQQFELAALLQKNRKLTAVVDASDLLQNPEQMLNRLCKLLEIPFDKGMLKWTTGGRPEDGIWAKYWYKNVHQSTGFLPYNPKPFQLIRKMADLAKEADIYYHELLKMKI